MKAPQDEIEEPMFEPLLHAHWWMWKAREFPGFHARLGEMRAEADLTHSDWVALQTKKLCAILQAASNHVPYYRDVFAAAGFDPDRDDVRAGLESVPLLTKDIIQRNHELLISKAADPARIRPNSTGGSTGVPLNFVQDEMYLTISMALMVHVPEWWGIRPYDKTASVWGADQDFADWSWRERLYMWRSRTRILNAFRMNEDELDSYARMLERWKAPYLKGYSTALEALARHVVQSGRTPPQFKAISSSAETLWPHQRQLIEETFRSPVYDFYGSREVSCLAAECAQGRRLHQVSTWRYIEIVDDDGKQVPDGEPGYVAVTDASNFSMPFIRYINGDLARFATERCPCGRPAPVLQELLGRSTDMIKTEDGENVHGEYFTHLFYGRDDIRQFQIHQVALDQIIVRYVPKDASREPSLSDVVERIRDRLGHTVRVQVEACDEIPSLPSGKRRFTISDVSGLRGDVRSAQGSS